MRFKSVKPATLALLAGIVVLAGVMIVRTRQGQHSAPPAATAPQLAPTDAANLAQLRFAGRACFDTNDFACAVDNYQKALALSPNEAALWSALGEARVMASQHDPMPAAARDAFRRAIDLSPKDSRARYFLAVDKDLHGDHQGAITDWLTLLAQTPQGAPWEKDLRRTIEQVGKINKLPVAERLAAVKQPPAPRGDPYFAGPSAEDLAAARAIPPSEQHIMAVDMVEKLEGRLATEPHNTDGWIMLIRSRVNLGQPDRARAALARALAADPANAAQIRAAAGQLGVK